MASNQKRRKFLRSRFGLVAAGDHRNITYIQVASRRPACIGTAARERMRRWCLDWAHEDFKIYSVPGSKNLFNDFHSRNGAPMGAEFFTLQQHAEQVDKKLARMRREDKGNPASQLLDDSAPSATGGNSMPAAPAATDVSTANVEAPPAGHEVHANAASATEDVIPHVEPPAAHATVNRQFLVIVPATGPPARGQTGYARTQPRWQKPTP